MEQNAFMAINTMLGELDPKCPDPDVRMKLFERVCDGQPPQAIQEAAWNFLSGEADLTGRMTSRVFAKEVKRVAGLLPYRNRKAELPAPEPARTKGASPYEIGLAKMERDFEGYKLAAKNIALHVFNERAREGKYPPGTRWQAGRVYVPDSVRTQATESA